MKTLTNDESGRKPTFLLVQMKRELLDKVNSITKNNTRQTTGIALPNINSLKNSRHYNLCTSSFGDGKANPTVCVSYNNDRLYNIPAAETVVADFKTRLSNAKADLDKANKILGWT